MPRYTSRARIFGVGLLSINILKTVSYTHLFGTDVPKGNYADLTTKGFELSVSWRDQFQLASKPVSYTHIDVYKRQETARAISALCEAGNITLDVFIDLNVGMNRTGVLPERAEALEMCIRDRRYVACLFTDYRDGYSLLL